MDRKNTSKLLVAVTGVLVFTAAAFYAALGGSPDRTSTERPDGPADEAPFRTVGEDEIDRSGGVDTPPGTTDTLLVARGREIFRSVGCTGCHAAEGVGRSRLPIDGVGARLSPDTLRAWVVDPRSVDPSVRKPAYDHLPEGDVDALVAYMQSLDEERYQR